MIRDELLPLIMKCRRDRLTPIQESDAIIAALPDMIPDLVWDIDGMRVRLDDTLHFGKGYDYDGLDTMRQEAYGIMSDYLIWPDHISSDVFRLYCTVDGQYSQSISEDEAKAAANTHHRAAWATASGIFG